MGIISKLKGSIEAKKQSYGVDRVRYLPCNSGNVRPRWRDDVDRRFHWFHSACFLFAGLFALAAGVVNFTIEAKDRDENGKLYSAKEEVKHDAVAITAPLKIAQQSVPEEAVFPSFWWAAYFCSPIFPKARMFVEPVSPMGDFSDRPRVSRFADLFSSGLVALTLSIFFTLSKQPRRTTIRGPLSRVNGDARGREATKPSKYRSAAGRTLCYGSMQAYRTTAFALAAASTYYGLLANFRLWQRSSRFTAFSPIRTRSAVS